jgi:hypothetical protein
MAILLLSQAFLIVVLVSVLEANGGNGKEEGHERNMLAATPRKENTTVRFRRPAQSLPSSP